MRILLFLEFLLEDCLPLLEVTTVVDLDNSAFALAEWAIEVGNLKREQRDIRYNANETTYTTINLPYVD